MAAVHILFTVFKSSILAGCVYTLWPSVSPKGNILQPEDGCMQEETACFTLAYVANHLPARCFLSEPETEIYGCEISVVGRVMHKLGAVALYVV